MANKHSRQGLALGVSLALGVTTLGVLPAQAVDYENLELTIAADDTNGVLATTMENDFELELEWDISDASDLAHLKYEVTFISADENTIDAKGSATGLSWDAAEDDIDVIEEFDGYIGTYGYTDDTPPSVIISAPAHISGDDETVDYTYSIENVDTGTICQAGTIAAFSSVTPPVNYSYNWTDTDGDAGISMSRTHLAGPVPSGTLAAAITECSVSYEGANDNFNVTFSAGTGFSGSLDEPAPSSFESVLWLESVSSADDYVDAVVEAWLDKDGDNVKDSTESYAAPVTVRFWNPTALTPALELGNEGVVWGEDSTIDYTVYLTQELNETYTTSNTK